MKIYGRKVDEEETIEKDDKEDDENFESRDETNVPLGEKLRRRFAELDAKFRK